MEISSRQEAYVRCNMSRPRTSSDDHCEPGLYVIRIKGHLVGRWADWFEGLTITLEDNGATLLTGRVTDQAALHSLLRRVRDLGMPLLSVNCVEPDPSTALPLQDLG